MTEANEVKISLFNVMGKEVSILSSGTMPQGKHKFEWQSKSERLPQGLYFLRIQIGDERYIQTVIHMGQ